MPADAPAKKLEATRGYGAEVILYDRVGGTGEKREAIAARLVAERGAVLVPPYDDDAVIAGQGTLALEMLEDVPDLDLLITPCGGGGLLSGVAVGATSLRKGIRLFGVEPEAGDDMLQSVALGRPVEIAVPKTIADCLQTTRPAERTLAIIRALVEEIVTVSDQELVTAMRLLLERMKVVVEPGGTAGLAALLAGKVPSAAGKKVGIVLSGGNVDPALLTRLLADQTADQK
jgi:threonine dehydratase